MAFVHPFYFLRHGETHWNREGRTQGQLEAGLNETGREQALRAADALAAEPIARIVASPLSRALDTARIVAERHDLPVETDDGLMECHLGEHQGGPHGAWLGDYFRGAYDPPGGERFDAFCGRVWAAMERSVAKVPNTLIVAHGGLWIAARTRVAFEPDLPRMPNALPLCVTPGPTRWVHRICGRLEPVDDPEPF